MEPRRVLEQDSISLGLTFMIMVNVERQGRAFECGYSTDSGSATKPTKRSFFPRMIGSCSMIWWRNLLKNVAAAFSELPDEWHVSLFSSLTKTCDQMLR